MPTSRMGRGGPSAGNEDGRRCKPIALTWRWRPRTRSPPCRVWSPARTTPRPRPRRRRGSAAHRVSHFVEVLGATHTDTRTHSNMSQAIRLPVEEGALVLSLHEKAERLGVRLVVGPWRDVADLARRGARRVQRVHAWTSSAPASSAASARGPRGGPRRRRPRRRRRSWRSWRRSHDG
jgi:hypothetical protein